MRIWLSVAANIIRACQMRTQQVEHRCSTDSVCDLMYPEAAAGRLKENPTDEVYYTSLVKPIYH